MKKFTYLLSTLALVLVLNGNALGQEVTASAEVVSSIGTEGDVQNVNFGTIFDDITQNTPTLDPSNSAGNANINGSYQLGNIIFSGTGNKEITITNGTGNTNLNNGDYLIQFNPDLCYNDGDSEGQTTCSETSAGTDNHSITVASEDFSGTGTLWIGGTLTNPRDSSGETPVETTSLPAGTYEGSITINIDYSF